MIASNLPFEILALVGLTFLAVAIWVWSFFTSRRREVEARLESLTSAGPTGAAVSVITDDAPRRFWYGR
jgi:hypothetical protein